MTPSFGVEETEDEVNSKPRRKEIATPCPRQNAKKVEPTTRTMSVVAYSVDPIQKKDAKKRIAIVVMGVVLSEATRIALTLCPLADDPLLNLFRLSRLLLLKRGDKRTVGSGTVANIAAHAVCVSTLDSGSPGRMGGGARVLLAKSRLSVLFAQMTTAPDAGANPETCYADD